MIFSRNFPWGGGFGYLTVMEDEFAEGNEVWDVLGRSPRREASPWFADRVLRAVDDPRPVGLSVWWRWALPAGVGCALAVLTLAPVVSNGPGEARYSVTEPVVEFETIDNLDLIAINNESSLWLDNVSSSSSF